MIYNICLFVGITFVFCGGVLFLAYGMSALIGKDVKYLCVAIIGAIILLLGIWGLFIYDKHTKSPEVIKDNADKEYQKLLKDIDIANKELQKFYIDHPEYKLEEQEND